MNTKLNYYKIAVGLLGFVELQNAVGELIPLQEVIVSFRKTLLPETLLPFLVATKVLAAVVLLLPGFYQLKEWVFAGILIDVLGAGFSYSLAGAYGAFGLYMVPPALLLWVFAYVQFRRHARSMGYFLPGFTHVRWRAVTYPFAILMMILGASELSRAQPVIDSMNLLAFPIHSLFIIGSAKVLGGAALLLRGLTTVKHWAYAGFVFDFLGAVYLYLASGQYPVFDLAMLAVLLLWLAASYWLFCSAEKNKG